MCEVQVGSFRRPVVFFFVLLMLLFFIPSWNLKHPFINGCFNWMIPNLYIGNCCFTKHLFINGCLGFQLIKPVVYWSMIRWGWSKKYIYIVGCKFHWKPFDETTKTSWWFHQSNWMSSPGRSKKNIRSFKLPTPPKLIYRPQKFMPS